MLDMVLLRTDCCLSGSDECWGKSTQTIQTASVITGSSLPPPLNLDLWAGYLWANPRDMALISLGGSPVMRLSIWPLMHLISSATAGLWMQLRSSFSWKPRPVSDTTLRHSTRVTTGTCLLWSPRRVSRHWWPAAHEPLWPQLSSALSSSSCRFSPRRVQWQLSGRGTMRQIQSAGTRIRFKCYMDMMWSPG